MTMPVVAPAPVAATAPDKPKWWLIAIGGAVIALFVGGVVLSMAVGTKTTVVGHAGTTSKTATVQANETTTTKGVPSDTVLEAILATGGVLILVGFLYGRISTIKIPGGGEIDLSADEKQQVASAVATEAAAQHIGTSEIPAMTTAALEAARHRKRQQGSLSLSDISGLVVGAARNIAQSA